MISATCRVKLSLDPLTSTLQLQNRGSLMLDILEASFEKLDERLKRKTCVRFVKGNFPREVSIASIRTQASRNFKNTKKKKQLF